MSEGSDVESVKARITAAIDVARNALGGLQQSQGEIDKASAEVQAACNGSGQSDAAQVAATLNEATKNINDGQQGVQRGIQEAEAIVARL